MTHDSARDIDRPVHAVIFDMDGVVVDSEPLHEEAQAQVFAEFDLPVPAAEYVTFKGRPERDVFTDLLDRYDPEGRIDFATILERKHTLYRELLGSAQPVEGALDFIRFLSGRVRMALATSATRIEQRRVFELFDLDEYFEAVISADDVVRAKPHPEPYRKAIAALDVDPASALVIEDSVLGVESSLAAGCLTAGLVGTFSEDALYEAGAHLVVHSFDGLIALWGNPDDRAVLHNLNSRPR